MHRIDVDSTLLSWVAYAPHQHRLQLGFRRGEVYNYLDVPESIYRDLLAADSKGRYFNQNIRNLYRTQQVLYRSAT